MVCASSYTSGYNGLAMLLRTLGGLRLEGSNFSPPQPLLLLAYLALEGPKERRFLAELFWMGANDPLNRLSSALAKLRKAVPDAVEADSIRVWTNLVSDAQQLLSAVRDGCCEEALELYRGPFLEGVLVDAGAELEEWIYATRERLAGCAREALLMLAEREAARERFEAASERAEAALRLPGASEPEGEVLERLMLLLQAGRSAYATELLQEAQDWGVEAVPSTEAAQSRLREKLKNATTLPRHNLPVQSTPFVGREAELHRLEVLLLDPACRLLTITAPGGMGKTRLALAAAERLLANFADGVFFVPLASVENPEQIVYTLAEALSFTFTAQGEPEAQLLDYLRSRQVLLVLDNLEHLLDGTGLIGDLLAAAPEVKVLATSRERLKLRVEWLFELRGLAFPEVEAEGSDYDAIHLFMQTARHVRPSFELSEQVIPLVGRICRLVEGLPLAIELAAAWLEVLSPKEIAAEIERGLDFLETEERDVPERQRSIRAVFDASWKRLTEEEQDVFMKLSVFRGGFTREAAQAVAGADLIRIRRLLNKSFVSLSHEGRYGIHELLRQYGNQKLISVGSATEICHLHGLYYLHFVRERVGLLRTPKRAETRRFLRGELANIRTAWEWAVDQLNLEEIKRSALPISDVFETYNQEGMRLFSQAIAGLKEANSAHHAALGYVLIALGEQETLWQVQPEQSALLVQRGLALLRPLREPRGTVRGLSLLGLTLQFSGEYDRAKSVLQEGLALARKYGSSRDISELLVNLALVERELKSFPQVRRYMQEALEELRDLRDIPNLAYLLLIFGSYLIYNEGLEEGQAILQESLRLAQEVGGDQLFFPFISIDLARAAYGLGDLDKAETLLNEALKVAREDQRKHAEATALALLGRVATARGNFNEAERHLLTSLQVGWSDKIILSVLHTLVLIAEYHAARGDIIKAVRWLSHALHHPATEKRDKDEARRCLEKLRGKLDEAAFKAAWSEGRAMGLEQAITYALENSES